MQQRFLLQILLLVQHVSVTTMIYIKITATCFGVNTPSSGSLQLC